MLQAKTAFNRVFSHDVTAAILVSQNNETAAMLVSQTNPVGDELFSYANAFFCSHNINLHRCWPRE